MTQSSGDIDVAIVGGGIAGLVLALTLHQHAVKCTIYELREAADIANPGAIGLKPNALRALDKLGLHQRLAQISWPVSRFQFRDEHDTIVSTIDTGDPRKHGYNAIRIVRRRLHDILLEAVSAAGIQVSSGKKFSHVVSNDPSNVTFAFADGSQVTASLLIGADGIHSTVRHVIDASITPEYIGNLTLAALLPKNPLFTLPQTSSVQERIHSISITNGPQAAFIAIAQSPDGQEVTLAVDRPFPDKTREEWSLLLADKKKQYDLFTEGYDDWPETVQMLMRAVTPDNMYRSWPFYAIPDLEQWCTPDRKIILVGDAAHAVPPSAGQGACMAIEDASSLGIVLGGCQKDSLKFDSKAFIQRITDWQTERRNRVDLARTMTKKMGNARLPPEVRQKMGPGECFLGGEQDNKDMMRLFGYEYGSSGS